MLQERIEANPFHGEKSGGSEKELEETSGSGGSSPPFAILINSSRICGGAATSEGTILRVWFVYLHESRQG